MRGFCAMNVEGCMDEEGVVGGGVVLKIYSEYKLYWMLWYDIH